MRPSTRSPRSHDSPSSHGLGGTRILPIMIFRQLFDNDSSTYTYLLADATTREAVIIDAVFEQVDRDSRLIEELGLTLRFALDLSLIHI